MSALLSLHEPPSVVIERVAGRSPVVLTCDHASKRVPTRLENLGLTDAELDDHIGWDPGAAEVARGLSERLDAPLVLSGYSRLVIDLNRPLDVPSSIPLVSGGVTIPGNQNLSDEDRRGRATALFEPYHRAIFDILETRKRAQKPTVLLALHSFTPILAGVARPWPCAVLYGVDGRFALAVRRLLEEEEPSWNIGDNEPYRVSRNTDYTIPVHAEARGLPGLLFEMRQDTTRAPKDIAAWVARLAKLVPRALVELAL